MALRAIIAALMMLAALAAGAYGVAVLKGAGVDAVRALFARDPVEGWTLCNAAAWAGLIAAALAVVAAFAAFFEDEYDDDFRRRRRGFPKIVPIILAVVALVLFWTTFDCADRAAPTALTRAAAPAALEDPASETVPAAAPEEETVAAAPAPADTPAPAVQVWRRGAPFDWPFMIPLISGGDHVRDAATRSAVARIFPDTDDARVRSALCGAAWVAVTGSASEEGPTGRNNVRARARTELAAAAAARLIGDLPGDCGGETHVFGVDLGQHAASSVPVRGDGSDTRAQRRVTVIYQARASIDDPLTEAEAFERLEAYLATPDGRDAVLAGRRFTRPPSLFTVGAR